MAVFSGVLEEGINELDNEATTKAKFFYQSCMDLRKYSGSLAAFFTHLSMYEKLSCVQAIIGVSRLLE